MEDARKQAVSLRLSTADLRKIKKLGQRLGCRDSDIIRFALKTMLTRLGPLCDSAVRGRALLPVFVEAGGDLVRHFDIDGPKLNTIVNAGVANGEEVDVDDLHLIAMAGMQQAYAKLSLNSLSRPANDRRALSVDDPLSGRLRSYLNTKYGDRESGRDAKSAND
jgi:hypothetical protein